MKRVFITGASGFLGLPLSKALQQRNVFTVALRRDVLSYAHPMHWDAMVQGDLSNIETLDRTIAEYRIDTVFHLAAQTEVGVGRSDPVGTFEANVRGTWNVLEACRRQKVRRVIVASSDKAYGRSKPPYKEGMELRPDRPYETSKACVDLIAHTYASTYGMSIATTRCVNLYGPGKLMSSTLIPNTIKRILDGKPPIIRNGGIMRRDWLYISDAVSAYLRLAESDYVGPINFGGGRGIRTIDIVRTLQRLTGSHLKPVNQKDVHGEIVDQWADTKLARRVLGWKPYVGIKEGLLRTVNWYEANASKRKGIA